MSIYLLYVSILISIYFLNIYLFIYTCIYINVYLSIYQSLLMVIRSQFYDTVRGPANRDVHPSLGAQTYEDET